MGRKDLTKERQYSILDAAERCIAKYGLQGATLNNIASDAGINRGLIHHYIGNRDEVIQMMVERLLERYQNNFRNYIDARPENNHAEVFMDYYFDAWFDLGPEDDALILELLAESERDAHIHKLLLNLYNGFENMIARELAFLFPEADTKKLHSVSYSLMLFAFSHATLTWLGLSQAKTANVRSVAATLVQMLQ